MNGNSFPVGFFKGPSHKMIISIILIVTIIISCSGWSTAFAATGEIEIAMIIPSVAEIANLTYENNLKQLDPVEQQLLKNAMQNIEMKYSKDPEGYISMTYMAMVEDKTDPKEQAIIAAWGVQKYPESVCLLNNFGFALYALKNNDYATALFKHTLSIAPNSLETIVNLGNIYLDTGYDDMAKAQYESAIAIDENYYKAWEGLYGYYMKKNDLKNAMNLAAKVLPGGFVMQGVDKTQDELDKEPASAKLEYVKEDDSLERMEQKTDRITESKPLTLAPVVDEIDADMAQKIKDSMENLGISVIVPNDPWIFDFSSAKEYYISDLAYSGVDAMSDESTNINIDPEIQKKSKQIEGLSKEDIDKMVSGYLKGAEDIMNKMQGMDMNDIGELADLIGQAKGIAGSDPLSGLSPSGSNGQSSISEQLGLTEKKGTVTISNYNNFMQHKLNFSKYLAKIAIEFGKKKDEIGKRFETEMTGLLKQQNEKSKDGEDHTKEFINERNSLRDVYVQEFGSFLMSFYNSHVKKAIEKVEKTESLYIKNMANKNLRKQQAEIMKAEINSFLDTFSKAQAPIDGYEAVDESTEKAIQERIEKLKASAPKNGETIPKLKAFEDNQKSLLEKIYEDTKFETTIGLMKVSYENAELTVGLNDPIHDEYMDLGVNLKDFSASLTEGKGYEVGFKVAEGVKGTKLEGIEAKIGYSDRQPGQKTTIYFDDNFNAVDAQITKTSGSQGMSAEVGANDLSMEGGLKIESTAEGTSQFVSSLKAAFHNVSLWEKQYREDLGQ